MTSGPLLIVAARGTVIAYLTSGAAMGVPGNVRQGDETGTA